MTTQRFDPKSIDRALANIEADFEWELTFMFVDDPDREYHPGINSIDLAHSAHGARLGSATQRIRDKRLARHPR